MIPNTVHLRSGVAWIAQYFGLPSLKKTCFWVSRYWASSGAFLYMWVSHGPYLSSRSNTECFSRVISRPPLQEMLASSSAKSSEMKAVVHMRQQLSSCLGPSAVEHQSSKGCLDIQQYESVADDAIFGGDIVYFCILKPNSLGFLYVEVKLELGNCFFLHSLRKSFFIFLNCPFFSPLLWLFF